MRPMDESRERFLAAIAQRISGGGTDQSASPESTRAVIEEVYILPPIRQGGAESGVAVVAVALPETAAAGEDVMPRMLVYTAKYKLTLKGPDRGKWEFSMHPDADAPLPMVDKVVRGVQQRSGYAEEAARLTGAEVLEALSGRFRSAPP